jgi:hypothetical protein
MACGELFDVGTPSGWVTARTPLGGWQYQTLVPDEELQTLQELKTQLSRDLEIAQLKADIAELRAKLEALR